MDFKPDLFFLALEFENHYHRIITLGSLLPPFVDPRGHFYFQNGNKPLT